MSSDPTNGRTGAVMTYDEAADLTLPQVKRQGITLVRDEDEKALVEARRRSLGNGAASRSPEEVRKELRQLAKRTDELGGGLGALVEGLAVLCVVERNPRASEAVAAVLGPMNDAIPMAMAPLVARIGDQFRCEFREIATDIRLLVSGDDADEE